MIYNRKMRLIVMYDLPNKEKYEVKEAAQFRKKLIKLGFYMIQFSIYGKVCTNSENLNKYLLLVKNTAPKIGNLRIMKVTEKQYQDMEIVLGNFDDFNISSSKFLEVI